MITRSSLAIAAAALMAAHPGPAAGAGGRDLAGAYAAALGVALEPVADIFAGAPVATDELDDMRGGFSLPGGLSVSFGFEIETRVNGLPVQRLTMPQASLAAGPLPGVRTGEGGSLASMPGGRVVDDRLVNGGATRVLTEIGAGGIVGAVQNRANNTVVDRRTTVDVDIQGMRGMIGRAGGQTVLQGALGTTRRTGR